MFPTPGFLAKHPKAWLEGLVALFAPATMFHDMDK